jgi:hypothetical protein
MKKVFLLNWLVALGLGAVLQIKATTVDPLTWEQLVSGADFVGIVECQTAGGIVAKYTVVESWKGPAAGTAFSMAVAVNYWEPQFPIALCGERYLVTAYRTAAPARIMSTTSGGMVPLWWRQIPTDYRLPLFQGQVKLPLVGGEQSLHLLNSTHSDLDSFHKAVSDFLALDAEQQELRIWRALTEKYLLERGVTSAPSDIATLRKEMAGWKSPAQWVTNLLAFASREGDSSAVWQVFSQACTSNTLALLQSIPGHEVVPERILQSVRYRLDPSSRLESSTANTKDVVIPAEALAQDRATLQAGIGDVKFGKAFETLVQHDPDAVAKYLRTWRNAPTKWSEQNAAYELGSYFAWRCGKDRFSLLQSLIEAQEPFVRVAGAVYGAFENESWGITNLNKLMSLEGDAGVWAALNLARRGDKAAIPRAMEVFATRDDYGMSGVPHRNLQKRLMVLLSNSAKASGLAQPDPPAVSTEKPESYKGLYRFYTQWWEANKEKMTLSDPWLPILKQKKVD